MEWEADEQMKQGNFSKAREMFESLLRKDICKSKEKFYLLGMADCLALEGRLFDSLPVYCEAFKRGKIQPKYLLRFISGLTRLITVKSDCCVGRSTSDEDNAILQCGICTGILCDPITVSCGHSFCKVCLEKQEVKKCEHCDKPFSYFAFKTNVILQDVLEKSFERELEATRLRLEGNLLHRRKQSLQAIEKYREAEKLSKYSNSVFYFLNVFQFEVVRAFVCFTAINECS